MGDSSSESDKSKHPEDALVMVVEEDDIIFNSNFSVMAKLDNAEEATLLDIKQNLNDYSLQKLK